MEFRCKKCSNQANWAMIGISQIGINVPTNSIIFAINGDDKFYCNLHKPKVKTPYLIPIEQYMPYSNSDFKNLQKNIIRCP